MAPYLTSEQAKQVQLLPKYLCRICKLMKDNTQFSKKEHKDWSMKKLTNPRLNEITAQLRCRQCSGQQVTELQCQGQCGEWKPLDKFSKSQRSRGAQWCIECVLWKEAAEPGITTGAAPVNELAPDETAPGPNAGAHFDQNSHTASLVESMEATSITGYGSSVIGGSSLLTSTTPYHAFAEHKVAESVTGASSSAPRGFIPPHLRQVEALTASKASATTSTNANSIPPHLRRAPPPASNASSVSNPWETTSTTSGVSGASTARGSASVTPSRSLPGAGATAGNRTPQSQPKTASASPSSSSAWGPVAQTRPSPKGSFPRAVGTRRGNSQQSNFPADYSGISKIVLDQSKDKEKEYFSDGESADEM